ncbi:MAG: hypothetical protein LC634_04915 [Sphingomonadales bacterium]|nr:hypothetical protein [Sphingomonadales bacterium]
MRSEPAEIPLVPPIPEGMKILDWHLGKDLAKSASEYTAQRIAEHKPLQEMRAD